MKLEELEDALPLRTAQSHFLQPLIERFKLSRFGTGTRLEVRFHEETPTIRRREGKSRIQEVIPEFDTKAERYQAELDSFLIERRGSRYHFDDPEFPFRFGNGGVLPLIRYGRQEYFCFFYREVFPIGWNIANGGADNRFELINPMDTLERELREELLVMDPVHRRQYVFDGDTHRTQGRPEFAVAQRFWQETFGFAHGTELEQLEIPLSWLKGPDSVRIRYGDEAFNLRGCYLNINGRDWGIEIDKVAKLNVDEDAVLCDGEILEGGLINAPVGMFETSRFTSALAEGSASFEPDFFFYEGERHEASELERVIHDDFVTELLERGAITPEEHAYFKAEFAAGKGLDLCPATRGIVRRFSRPEPEGDVSAEAPEVFVSAAGADAPLARLVFDHLQQRGRRAYFYEKSLRESNFGRAIDDALDQARSLVVVGTRAEHLQKGWVEYEWQSFHNDLNSGRKPSDSQLVSFIQGFSPLDLPRPLRHRTAIECPPEQIQRRLRDLEQLIAT